ncbi:hypothetical protein HNR44_002463 [Geomicrobium halophilum]|uniref:Uncharacterized protein n=1 Tax=Geomicrobium halophilum TaxID=549000 RepID=A0A841PNY7_9BACL|nr:hypothetical protein [Geomicrobium halophilum]MBB6450480.1 hypothetical protein [Geomicrobium halophilum]
MFKRLCCLLVLFSLVGCTPVNPPQYMMETGIVLDVAESLMETDSS